MEQENEQRNINLIPCGNQSRSIQCNVLKESAGSLSSSSSCEDNYSSDDSDWEDAKNKKLQSLLKTSLAVVKQENVKDLRRMVNEKVQHFVRGAVQVVPNFELRISHRKENDEERDAEDVDDQVVTYVFTNPDDWTKFTELVQSDNNLKVDQNKKRTASRRIFLIGNLSERKKGFPPVKRSIKYVCKSHALDYKPPKRLADDKERVSFILHKATEQCAVVMYAREHEGGIFTVTINEKEATHTSCSVIEPSKFPIPPITKRRIVSLLSAGFSVEKVHSVFVDDKELFKQANEDCEELSSKVEKVDLLTVNDVKTIAKSIGTNNGLVVGRKESDYSATARCLFEMADEFGFKYFLKFPGKENAEAGSIDVPNAKHLLETDHYYLFLVVPFMIKYYGGISAICADFTHNVTIYNGPQLGIVGTSIGDAKEVENFFIPLLYIITTSPSSRTAEFGFSLMLSLNSAFNPLLLMSDLGAQFKIGLENALKRDIVWLWCLFHIMQAWKRKGSFLYAWLN